MTDELFWKKVEAAISSNDEDRNLMICFADYALEHDTISKKVARILKAKFPFWSWLSFRDVLQIEYEKKKDRADLSKIEQCERKMVYIRRITGQYTPLMICGGRDIKKEDIGPGYYPPVNTNSPEILGMWFLTYACKHEYDGGRSFHYIKSNEWNYFRSRIPSELFERWINYEREYFENEGYFEAKARIGAVDSECRNKLKEFYSADLDECVALRWGDGKIIRIVD